MANEILRIRNIGIIAHIDAGKTTTTERILFYSHKVHRIGSVDEGTATTDWYEEEQKRGITIFSAATTVYWNDFSINIIDTPGHVDFTAEVERSLRVLDGAVAVFCGVGGVEAQSETVWRQADSYNVPRIAYINKLDRTGSDYYKVIEAIKNKLNARPIPLNLPIGEGSEFKGIVDLIKMKAVYFDKESDGGHLIEKEIPGDLVDNAKKTRETLIDAVAEFDDNLLEKFLRLDEIFPDELIPAIRKATISGTIVPTLAGASLKNIGVQPVMDSICNFLPSPADVNKVTAYNYNDNSRIDIDTTKYNSLSALAFKTATDKHGELTYVRIYSGILKKGDAVYNPRLKKRERVSRLIRIHADSRQDIDKVMIGDIVGVIGFKETSTGDTLCDKCNPLLLEQIKFPETVISMAIEPKSSSDRDKLLEILKKLTRDDPTFKTTNDVETGQILIHGMGELHLEIIKHRIVSDFNTRVNVGLVRVSYRESINSVCSAEVTHKVKIADKNYFGHISLIVSPDKNSFNPVVEFNLSEENRVLAKKFIEPIKESLISASKFGNLAGYPCAYLKISVNKIIVTKESHEVAYSVAANKALKDAIDKVSQRLLEPSVKIELSAPSEYLSAILNDLNERNFQVKDIDVQKEPYIIQGSAPLAKMFGYATTMRSLTHGRGFWTMEPFEYRDVPESEVREMFKGFY